MKYKILPRLGHPKKVNRLVGIAPLSIRILWDSTWLDSRPGQAWSDVMHRISVDLVQFVPQMSAASLKPANRMMDPECFVVWYEILGLSIPEIAAEYDLDEARLRPSFEYYRQHRQQIVSTWMDRNIEFNKVSRIRTA